MVLCISNFVMFSSKRNDQTKSEQKKTDLYSQTVRDKETSSFAMMSLDVILLNCDDIQCISEVVVLHIVFGHFVWLSFVDIFSLHVFTKLVTQSGSIMSSPIHLEMTTYE